MKYIVLSSLILMSACTSVSEYFHPKPVPAKTVVAAKVTKPVCKP